MPTDVVMPQMGESIAEGTIVRWIKKIGDKVDRDEPLFEISTDKVDAEIPAPAAGVVTEIRHQEGETVPVNTVVAVIGQATDAPSASGGGDRARHAPSATPPPSPPPSAQADGSVSRTAGAPGDGSASRTAGAPAESSVSRSAGAPADAPLSRSTTPPAAAPLPPAAQAEARSGEESRQAPVGDESSDRESGPSTPGEDVVRQRSSPLVRRIAKEHNVDISQLNGTGISGRVTRDDILQYIDQQKQQGSAGPVPAAGASPATAPAASRPAAPPAPSFKPGASDRVEKMSVMRKRIAEHMVLSRRTSAHVHTVFEVNFSRVAQIREAKKKQFEAAGAKLTFLSFILGAVVEALRAVPVVNASVDGDNIVYHKDINLGVAVALDWGLIVPVIKNAGEKNLLGLSRAVADLAARARAKQLKPDEVSGGTFTITNPGVFGALFGMPIINQPQVAILGVGAIQKRAVVIDDAIAIRPMGYLTLGYDHRLIDGAVADEFLVHIKQSLENRDPDIG
jgi:pyruvate dehydrogenase E2 component (dihydrolipoyllysine-residue acetyltransferase)